MAKKKSFVSENKETILKILVFLVLITIFYGWTVYQDLTKKPADLTDPGENLAIASAGVVPSPTPEALKDEVTELEQELKQYVESIEYDNAAFRKAAIKITEDCPSGDKECELISIYYHVVDNYKYYSDARDAEHVQSPTETQDFGGGDCEDLAILLNSYLENIGISTYLILTEDHAYSAACGDFDSTLLEDYTYEMFTIAEEIDHVIESEQLTNWHEMRYGGNETFNGNYWIIDIDLRSNMRIDVFTASEEGDTLRNMNPSAWIDAYNIHSDCLYEDVLSVRDTCIIPNTGGIYFLNTNPNDAWLDYELTVTEVYSVVDMSDFSIQPLEIGGQTCIVADPSLGEYGWLGEETTDWYERMAIDSVTHETFDLSYDATVYDSDVNYPLPIPELATPVPINPDDYWDKIAYMPVAMVGDTATTPYGYTFVIADINFISKTATIDLYDPDDELIRSEILDLVDKTFFDTDDLQPNLHAKIFSVFEDGSGSPAVEIQFFQE